jgi:hypothetical protein
VTDGMPVDVALGSVAGGIDIALTTGGRIGGTVSGGSPAAPLAGILVDFINAAGATSSSVGTNSAGTYLSGGLPPGTYYARTRGSSSAPPASQGFANEVFDNVACSGCSPTSGTPITVAAGATTPNIDFVLAPGGRVSGRVTDLATGSPLAGVTVQFYSRAGL